VFLRIQGIGGFSRHLSGHPACSGYTQLRVSFGVASRTLASIDFKCVTYKDLGADNRELGSHHPHMRGHF
jgi:hypothetical protein